MKIQRRFIEHFLLGVLIWILLLAATLPVTMEGILPYYGLVGEGYEWVVLVIVGVISIISIVWFGWYFGSPLIRIMSWIKQLAEGDFASFHDYENTCTKNGKFKMRYRLYKEVIDQLMDMRTQLERARVERAEVEEAKRDWIAGISHDLKTPLTYIKGYSTLLLNPDYKWSEEEQRNFVEEIDKKGTHMEQLVEDLNLAMRFDSSQTVPIHKTTQDIVGFTRNVLTEVSNDLRAQSHQFELRAEHPVQVAFDPKLLKRALQNLFMNAVVHNEAPVTIITTIEQRVHEVVLTIQDDGIGMTEETVRNVFNRYFRGTTTEQTSEGTGLGVAIVKSLVEAHDGTIEVKSTFQKGTTITITLPSMS
ncbi:sensor histidine kinase KdpD [Sporosarcina sp. Te-1]|uniref:sensor histidine kinase n=1 Tax=Sporosarcina sp. Te-1 TaxID=2818390 RepID=UPI001A9E2E27|nr:HAMP domain-containing sensor histidine kinase [Sporosarcina sp. Te-1]QTD42725.1 HAMP domain-containing histidine kinase [Sporosarcina sp. Te-1]